MHRVLLLLSLLVVFRCATPAPPPVAAPATPPPPPAAPAQEQIVETVRVTASALNVRAAADADAELVTQVKKGTSLAVLESNQSWMRVRLADGRTGWVASRFVSRAGETKTAGTRRTTPAKKGGCPADSDYAFTETPTLRGSDSNAHGIVVVEAAVNVRGVVTSTKVVSNSTGDEALAFLAEREIKSARFSPPIRNCVPRAFIFTYRRTF